MDLDLWFMPLHELRKHVLTRLVQPICYHRDQRGDDRCWFDDLSLYWCLPESIRRPVKLSTQEMAERCAYYRHCRSDQNRPRQAALDPEMESERCAKYLNEMPRLLLILEGRKLRKGVRDHRDKPMISRTVADDKKLYALVRGGMEADFRLPPAEVFLPNCALICSLMDPNNVDLSHWPDGRTSPLANWRPDD